MDKNDLENEREETSWIMGIIIIVLYFIPYGIINHFPLNRHVIPFILGEHNIPFLPWTFVIYISVFLQALIILRYLPKKILKKAMPIMGGMVFVALVIFVLFPVEYPRMLYTSDSPLIALFRITDGPGNCFPSLHVAVTMTFSFLYMMISRSFIKRTLMWLWTLAVCISVLTTKQHYLIDIFGGIAISLPTAYLIVQKARE